MLWALPTRVEVGGTSWEIRGDYRYILRIIHNLSNPDREESVNRYVSMALFYVHFREMPERLYPEALKKLYWFIDIGELPDTKVRPRVMDWEQDYHAIVADINKVAGHDVRSDAFCHWWTFISWFNGIGDGQLAAIVAIREKKRRGKKLTDAEREFYRANKEKVDLKPRRSQDEQEILDYWIGK